MENASWFMIHRRFISFFVALMLGFTFFTPTPSLAQFEDANFQTPDPVIDIPGISFTEAEAIKQRAIDRANRENAYILEIPYLAEYIRDIYRYAVGIAGSIAIIMIVVAGFQWSTSGGNTDTINEAKKRIQNAVIGLIILLASYSILYAINPNLVKFYSLQVPYIISKELPYVESEPDFIEPVDSRQITAPTNFETPRGENITGNALNRVPANLRLDIEAVGQTLLANNIGISITSAVRTMDEQHNLSIRNCENPPGSQTCRPKPGRPTTCILRGNNPINCPHTSGLAIDAWGTEFVDGRWTQCILSRECPGNNYEGCRTNRCQAALIAAMKDQGFCVLDSEPWHFEKPQLSPNCH